MGWRSVMILPIDGDSREVRVVALEANEYAAYLVEGGEAVWDARVYDNEREAFSDAFSRAGWNVKAIRRYAEK